MSWTLGMNMINAAAEVYVVKRGDTLTSISRATGKTIADLVRLNDIKNRNRLEVGQALYLSEKKAFAAQVLFLDALRHPIDNLKYVLSFDGKMLPGKSGQNGLTEEIVTRHARSAIKVLVQNTYGTWDRLGSFVSGHGKKLITLVSPSIMFKGQLEPHPPEAPLIPTTRQTSAPTGHSAKPPLPPTPKGKPSKNNPNVKLNNTKGKKGESIIQIGVDLPQDLLAYMQAYDGKPISEDDWKDNAKYLGCEVNILKAIAKVESGGRSAFWTINDNAKIKATAPKIVFERHYFHKLTQGKHDQTHPDISWPVGYQRRKDHPIGSAHAKLHDNRVDQDDLYDNQQDYLRLINAYRLDKVAAIKSASWGKFQIMGANHKICDQPDIEDFVAKMCKSEAGQIELLAKFIRNKKDRKNKKDPWQTLLWKAVKQKDWPNIARYYNGPKYKEGKYDEKLESAYKEYCKKTA